MNHDQQSVLAAYDDTIKKLYCTLFEQYVQAAGDAAQEQQAEQHFKTGVGLAQRTRDRAVALVG
jgi:phage terminase small subunit